VPAFTTESQAIALNELYIDKESNVTERKTTKVVSKRINHRKCDITKEDIANAPPVKMPQVTPEQHRERKKKGARAKNNGTSAEGEK
jgi:hypothetical protein